MQVKTCPFCGGRPYIERSQRGFINGESTKVCFVRCQKCNARSERINVKDYGHTSKSLDAVEKVVESWNRRSDSTKYVEIQLHKEKPQFELEVE